MPPTAQAPPAQTQRAQALTAPRRVTPAHRMAQPNNSPPAVGSRSGDPHHMMPGEISLTAEYQALTLALLLGVRQRPD